MNELRIHESRAAQIQHLQFGRRRMKMMLNTFSGRPMSTLLQMKSMELKALHYKGLKPLVNGRWLARGMLRSRTAFLHHKRHLLLHEAC